MAHGNNPLKLAKTLIRQKSHILLNRTVIWIFWIIHELGKHIARILGAFRANPESTLTRAILY